MDRKEVVLEYLKRCNTYAEDSITRKTERGEEEQIESWKSYIQFNDHAIEEIKNGTLDNWFTPLPTSSMESAQRIDVNELEHAQRAGWLAGLVVGWLAGWLADGWLAGCVLATYRDRGLSQTR